jgi:hypothetical protein
MKKEILNEGTIVYRPVMAEKLQENLYKIDSIALMIQN